MDASKTESSQLQLFLFPPKSHSEDVVRQIKHLSRSARSKFGAFSLQIRDISSHTDVWVRKYSPETRLRAWSLSVPRHCLFWDWRRISEGAEERRSSPAELQRTLTMAVPPASEPAASRLSALLRWGAQPLVFVV